jgi:hypothetical protein
MEMFGEKIDRNPSKKQQNFPVDVCQKLIH